MDRMEQQISASTTLITNEWSERTNVWDGDRHEHDLEIRRRTITLQMTQYIKYISSVRTYGLEPKDLLRGLGKCSTVSISLV